MSSQSLIDPLELVVRPLQLGQSAPPEGLECRLPVCVRGPGNTPVVTVDLWAIAVERGGSILASAWCRDTEPHGAAPRLILTGSLHRAGEAGMLRLLREAQATARRHDQRRFEMCLPGDQSWLMPLLERAGFHIHSSFSSGGIAEVVVEVDREPAGFGIDAG